MISYARFYLVADPLRFAQPKVMHRYLETEADYHLQPQKKHSIKHLQNIAGASLLTTRD